VGARAVRRAHTGDWERDGAWEQEHLVASAAPRAELLPWVWERRTRALRQTAVLLMPRQAHMEVSP